MKNAQQSIRATRMPTPSSQSGKPGSLWFTEQSAQKDIVSVVRKVLPRHNAPLVLPNNA